MQATDQMTVFVRVQADGPTDVRYALIHKLEQLIDSLECAEGYVSGGAINDDSGFLEYDIRSVPRLQVGMKVKHRKHDYGVGEITMVSKSGRRFYVRWSRTDYLLSAWYEATNLEVVDERSGMDETAEAVLS